MLVREPPTPKPFHYKSVEAANIALVEHERSRKLVAVECSAYQGKQTLADCIEYDQVVRISRTRTRSRGRKDQNRGQKTRNGKRTSKYADETRLGQEEN